MSEEEEDHKIKFEGMRSPLLALTPKERLNESLKVERTNDEEMEMPQRIGAPQEPPSNFTSVDLKELDVNLYIGEESALWLPRGARGVYGGQIVGQSLNACMKTVPKDRAVHSLHAYFLMAGDPKKNIIYQVKPLREGKSFSSRLVTAQQNGIPIFVMIASFQTAHVGRMIAHQMTMPRVPDPSHTLTMEEYYAALMLDPRCPEKLLGYLKERTEGNSPIDMRPIITSDFFSFVGKPIAGWNPPKHFPEIATTPKQAFWIRCKKNLPDDPTVHAAVLAYASDMGLLSTAKADASSLQLGVIASLDHSMWFHSPFRADEWLLYYITSGRAIDGRGLSHGFVFTEKGVLAVSVAQEGVIRLKKPRIKQQPKL